jgi:hypothetical protein
MTVYKYSHDCGACFCLLSFAFSVVHDEWMDDIGQDGLERDFTYMNCIAGDYGFEHCGIRLLRSRISSASASKVWVITRYEG